MAGYGYGSSKNVKRAVKATSEQAYDAVREIQLNPSLEWLERAKFQAKITGGAP